jgi:glycine betaine/proline transport system substrate-binding protein
MLALALGATVPAQADDAPTIKFGVASWPGIVVKSEVAAQILQTMGFATKQVNASPAFIITSLKTGNLDVYLGGWIPTEKGMIKPAAKQGKVKILAKNITGALMGLAVPHYVWKAGVHSEADLAQHADKFDHKIYGIEPGSGFNAAIEKAIDNNRDGLGNWKLVQVATSVMLSQVGRAIHRQQWIVFLGWQPHWMNIKYHINYLKAVGKPTIAQTKSNVLTVVNPELVKKYPNVARFLRQLVVKNKQQSQWVYRYSLKKRKAADVASQWIGDHLDTVAQWLKGVKTRNGKSAIAAVRAKYGAS